MKNGSCFCFFFFSSFSSIVKSIMIHVSTICMIEGDLSCSWSSCSSSLGWFFLFIKDEWKWNCLFFCWICEHIFEQVERFGLKIKVESILDNQTERKPRPENGERFIICRVVNLLQLISRFLFFSSVSSFLLSLHENMLFYLFPNSLSLTPHTHSLSSLSLTQLSLFCLLLLVQVQQVIHIFVEIKLLKLLNELVLKPFILDMDFSLKIWHFVNYVKIIKLNLLVHHQMQFVQWDRKVNRKILWLKRMYLSHQVHSTPLCHSFIPYLLIDLSLLSSPCRLSWK